MTMNALVMSRNTSAVKALVTAFAELRMEYRVSFSPSETMEVIASGQHSALVVDFDLPHATEVARMARIVPSKRKPVLFGMIGAGTPIAATELV